MNFYFTLRAPFAFWEADFHKIKGRETLSRSHNDLNTTVDNTGLIDNFSISTKMHNAQFKIFSFEISLFFDRA
jgi:hypothetical protein